MEKLAKFVGTSDGSSDAQLLEVTADSPAAVWHVDTVSPRVDVERMSRPAPGNGLGRGGRLDAWCHRKGGTRRLPPAEPSAPSHQPMPHGCTDGSGASG